jgi:hypothetical protein
MKKRTRVSAIPLTPATLTSHEIGQKLFEAIDIASKTKTELPDKLFDDMASQVASGYKTWQSLVDAKSTNSNKWHVPDVYKSLLLDLLSDKAIHEMIMKQEGCTQRKAVILLHRYSVIMGYKKARVRK